MDDSVSESDPSSISKKLKQSQAVLSDATDTESEEGQAGGLLSREEVDAHGKGKNALASNTGNSVSTTESMDGVVPMKSSTNLDDFLGSLSDGSYYSDEDDYGLDYNYYDDDDSVFESKIKTMQSHFDNVDLPPGVEAPLPWLKDPAPSEVIPANTKALDVLDISGNERNGGATSSTAVSSEQSSSENIKDTEDVVMQRFQQFKQFDVVKDFSDHHYSRMEFSEKQPPKTWAKKIQDEWRILEKDLPDTIYVRVYEARMELLRAVIIGPSSTPYHDGLFVFDCLFPSDYPYSPPMVYYYSGGLRLNPNLYECGKVCLSLLGTWNGHNNENWVPDQSTMLQVLVSIQALILNTEPFFNEPGHESSYPGAEGRKRSRRYSEHAFILSLKTMIYTLRRPPKHFEDFVNGHFRNRAHTILEACKAYSEGTIVGSVTKEAASDKDDASGLREFRTTVGRMINMLVTTFNRNGSTECEMFRVQA